jgi:hypothetical protein
MRKLQLGMAVLAFAAIGSLVAFAQAPAAPPAGQAPAGGQGRGAGGGRGAPANPGTFFITSVGKGDGANYGGLAGADAYCAQMAAAGNMPAPAGRTWRAYLSATAQGGQPAVNARDRIGVGPWHNKTGGLIANNVADLHGDVERDRNSINRNTALNEKGEMVNGVLPLGTPADPTRPNQHDILTGSDSYGRARPDAVDTTCSNYTSNAAPPEGTARGQGPGVWLGHHDRTGGGNSSWNATHKSNGCSQANLVATGGAGLLYCFAAN